MGEPALAALDRLQATFPLGSDPVWGAQVSVNRAAVLLALGRAEEARAAVSRARVKIDAGDHPQLARLVREMQAEIAAGS